MTPPLLAYRLFNITVQIDCPDSSMADLLHCNFQEFAHPNTRKPDIEYQIAREIDGLHLKRTPGDAEHQWSALEAGECLYLLEKDIALELQQRRADLYFLHAAALRHGDQGILLVGRSGAGKSTTCWGLVNRGFTYLSDELAPIDLQRLTIQPYPRALCLKTDPPAGFSLPTDVRRTEATLHIPIDNPHDPSDGTEVPVHQLIFIEHRGIDITPTLQPLRPARAGALLYSQALNPLQHPGDGLDAALRIAAACDCWQLTTGELSASLDLLIDQLTQG